MPSRNPVSQISAMRPSMMTLVSENLVDLLRSDARRRKLRQARKIQQIALIRTNNEADVGHQKQDENA